jgi:EAL domain-containing protein (putative c-di-GMP-specific phosphodiesterase class I)
VAAGVQVSIEASVGATTAECGDVNMAELLRRAEIAMYRAKRERLTVSYYDSGQGEADVDRLAMLAELREALVDGDQLFLLLHPTVMLDDCRTVSVEALVRWRHPRRGELKPVHFVRTVEQSDLLAPFTRHVLDLALGVSARLRRHGVDVPISVNLSPRSLLDSALPSVIAHLLDKHGVPAPGLVLEIIETVAISKQPVVDDVFAGLRALGVQLAVDDFGTGFSALTFLTRVPVDEIKIDRTFVSSMSTSAEAAAIVRTTIELGAELGLRVVAEGVETAEERKALLALGCQLAQGFLFHRPMPIDSVMETLRDAAPIPRTRLRLVNVDHEPPG